MAILVGILINARDNWKDPVKLIKYYQRGYEGPYRKEDIYNMLKKYLPVYFQTFWIRKRNS